MEGEPKEKMYKRKINESTIQTLIAMLKKESWEEVCKEKDVDKAYELFVETLNYYLDVTCPYVAIKGKTKPSKTEWNSDVAFYENSITMLQYCIKAETGESQSLYKNLKMSKRKLKKHTISLSNKQMQRRLMRRPMYLRKRGT